MKPNKKTTAVKSMRGHILFIPIAFLLHNIEEVVNDLPSFQGSRAVQLGVSEIYTPDSFLFAVISLSLIVSSIAVFSVVWKHRHTLALMIIITATIFTNALVHVFTSLLIQEYNPGLWTAIIFVIPSSVLFYVKLFELNLFTKRRIGWMSLTGAVIMTPIALLSLALAHHMLELI